MAERILGLDFDNVTIRTDAHLKKTLEIFYPGKFTSHEFESVNGEPLDPEFELVRHDYLRKSHFISLVDLCDRIPFALSVFRGLFDKTHINTNRWTDQEEVIVSYLKDKGIRKNIDSLFLRPPQGEHKTVAKVFAVGASGMNYVIEDYAPVAEIFAEKGIKVVLIDRPWNRRIPYHPNIRRYREAIDFALDLIMKDASPEQLFDENKYEPDNILKAFEIRRVSPGEAAELIIAHSVDPSEAFIPRPN